MTPDLERSFNEQMKQASLRDVMPGFDKEAEWQGLSQRLGAGGKRRVMPIWRYAAALLFLVACGSGITYFMTNKHVPAYASSTGARGDVQLIDWRAMAFPNNKDSNSDAGKAGNDNTKRLLKARANAIAAAIGTVKQPKHTGKEVQPAVPIYRSYAKGYVHNSTPYPIEICILQMIKCAYDKPQAIATCSTLAPDQKGVLKYKAPGKIAENCKVTVQEIRITRPTTGETIVLTANSKPATAQEVFNCITGKSKGDILAGAFYSDCEENEKQPLRIDNNFGNLILQ